MTPILTWKAPALRLRSERCSFLYTNSSLLMVPKSRAQTVDGTTARPNYLIIFLKYPHKSRIIQ